MEQANRVLESTFLPWFYRRCTVQPASGNDAHRPVQPTMDRAANVSNSSGSVAPARLAESTMLYAYGGGRPDRGGDAESVAFSGMIQFRRHWRSEFLGSRQVPRVGQSDCGPNVIATTLMNQPPDFSTFGSGCRGFGLRNCPSLRP
jgi:hypothetical protein